MYIPLTLVYSLTNYVGISCSTLKIVFKKLYDDSQFNKLRPFDGSVLKLILSFLIPSDIKKHGDDSMFSKTERFFLIDGVSQSNKTKFDIFIEEQQRFYFNCSYIFYRDDEVSIKFCASQKHLSGLVKQDNFRIFIRGVTFKTNIHHTIILISLVD